MTPTQSSSSTAGHVVRYPKPALLAELPPRRGVIQASAGTGKTYTLERMVVDFLLQGIPLEQILVVTFTDKATLELKARVRSMLETLAELEAGEAPEPCWEIGPGQAKALSQALRAFDRATIATIHGFCRRVLQESAFEDGSLLRRELTDGRAILGQAWRELVRQNEHAAFLEEALCHGWSFEKIEKLLWSVYQERGRLVPGPEVDPGALLRDFDPAWEGCLEELQAAKVHGATRNAALKRWPLLVELMAGHPSPWDFDEAWDFDKFTELCRELDGEATGPLGRWLSDLRALCQPEALLTHRLLGPLRARVQALKAEEGLYDHDDTVLLVREALRGPNGPALAARLRERYKVALIDEFQDTDQVQWEIFRTLFGAAPSRLYVIGDPKQAIYGFRGGDLATYEAAKAELTGGGEALELRDNFRSTPGVIDAYNHVLMGFFADPGLYPEDRQVRCGKGGLRLETRSGEAVPPVRLLRLERLDGGKRLWRRIARHLAREIRDLIETRGLRFGETELRELHYGDVQVLVGKASEGRLVAEALASAGIPYAFFKQDALFESQEAEDLLDLLRAILEPRDRSCLARALLTPFFGYGLEDLDALPGMAEDHPAILRLLDWQRLARQRHFVRLFEAILQESGLLRRLRLQTASERALTNHQHLAELLTRAAREGSPDLEDLIRLFRRWQAGDEKPTGEDGDTQRLEGEKRAVQILTMHKSKGLEAPVVALFGFTQSGGGNLHRYHEGLERRLYLGKPPAEIKARVEEEALEESRRLLYVALTRAKAHLLLPCFVVDKKTKEGGPDHPKGNYGVLNPRLRQILESDLRREFEVVEVTGERLEAADELPSLDLGDFEVPRPEPMESLDYEALRIAARPAFTTSFTALSHGRGEEGLSLDGERERPTVSLPPGALPKGARTGQLIHELMEDVDLKSAEGVPFEDWWPGRRPWVERALARHGMDLHHAEAAARMIHGGLCLDLEGAPLAEHDHALRELGFLSRFLDSEDLLTGAMDLIFERAGRIHLLDWKTNALPDYGPETLAACVAEDYLLQVKLYLYVLLAYFGIEDEAAYEARFGAVHYVFLRGPGAWSHRPAWAQVQAWREELSALHAEVAHA
ncbi:MAG: Exodeoxyribonuclease beta chain [Holophagaceae bacterium]|nr:Exodeoxyribonuclease beta chain [Holophagaceae bacterium]